MDTLPCPGCRTPLPPEATGCQICLRARTKQEIVRGYAALREEKSRRRKLPFKIAAAVLLAGAALKLGWERRAELLSAAAAARQAAAETAEDLTTPANLGAPPAAPLLTASQQVEAARSHGSDQAPHAGSPPPGASAPSAAAAAPPAKPQGPPKKTHWRISGSLYDLATLSPVSGAEISFLREGAEPVLVRAGDRGEFEVDIEKGGGWHASLRAPGYRDGQVLDLDPPYRSRDEEERRKAVENLTDGDLAPVPVEGNPRSSEVRLSLVAVPERWPRR